jgi:hypothetical protein
MYTKQERLQVYKEALKDYTASLKKEKISTSRGFCYYFNSNEKSLENFPELMAQEPTEIFMDVGTEYWFKPGLLEPRIECIKKAIKLCKEPNPETIEGRLKIYKRTLLYYSIYLFVPFKFRPRKIRSGFCYFINQITDFKYSGPSFPELHSLRKVWSGDEEYWFKPGKLWPRIQCLRKAIGLCKLDIIEQELSTNKNKEKNIKSC